VAAAGGDDNEPMPVAIDYQSWLPLTENWIHTQAKHLSKDVTPYVVCRSTRSPERYPIEHLVCYDDLSRSERLKILVSQAPRLGFSLRRKTALLAATVARFRIPLVHSHFGYTGYYSAKAIRRLGVRHVVSFYGVDMSALPASDASWIDRYQALFGSVDRVLCEGPCMAEAVRRLGCPADKVQVHHLGVDLDALPFRPRRWRPGEPLRVLISASFREKKGIPYAIRALGQIRRWVPLAVTIIGDAGPSAKSQAEKKHIQQAVVEAGLGDSITFAGYQPHESLREAAYQHHIFLSPSVTAGDGDTEGGAPVSLIEMAASGMPVVSTRHADIPEVIEDGVGGLLADERDVVGLAGHLGWLIEHPDAWESMLLAARARVEREFDARVQGARLAAVYREVAHR
jgi:colanic acid/amylovoran biosynthesis glycosyltransferase